MLNIAHFMGGIYPGLLRERPLTVEQIFRLLQKLEACRPVPAGPGPPPHPRWHLWVPWGSGGGFATNPATPPHPTPPFVAKGIGA